VHAKREYETKSNLKREGEERARKLERKRGGGGKETGRRKRRKT